MNNEKNMYISVDKEGKFYKVFGERQKDLNDLKEIVFSSFKNVNFITDNIFEHTVNGKVIKTLLGRVVHSGLKDQPYKKRMQITRKNVEWHPSDILAIYKFNDSVMFIHSSNADTLNDLPNSITSLFWININTIKEAFLSNELVKLTKKSRDKLTTFTLSKNPKDIYSKEALKIIEHDEFSLNDFDEIVERDIDDFDEWKKHVENNLLDIQGAALGRIGEEIVFGLLNEKSQKLKRLNNQKWNWNNEVKESFMPFDFKSTTDFLEVKSSSDENGGFLMSANEQSLCWNNYKNYWLVKISGLDINTRKFKKIVVYKGADVMKMTYSEIKTFVFKEGE